MEDFRVFKSIITSIGRYRAYDVVYADTLYRVQTNLEYYDKAIDAPEEAQRSLLKELRGIYCEVERGNSCGLETSNSIEDYLLRAPVVNYRDLKPQLEKIIQGKYGVLLPGEAHDMGYDPRNHLRVQDTTSN
jgi:hypothetical protein